MPMTLPLSGIYFRKGHFDDRLIDGLITVRISVAIITAFGVEEKELEFTGSDILTAITNMLAALSTVGALSGLPLSSVLGGDLPSTKQQRAGAVTVAAPTEE
jgi:hypothetical protein